MLLAALVGWLDQRQQNAVAYLIEENRILRTHLHGRICLTDEERRRLARHGHRLGRRRLGVSFAKTRAPVSAIDFLVRSTRGSRMLTAR